MKIQTLTAIVFWGLFGILMGYDFWALTNYGLEATVTYHWWTVGASHKILCTVFGVFTAHLFKTGNRFLIIALLAMVLGFPIWNLFEAQFRFGEMMILTTSDTFYAFTVGNLVGLLFWTETKYGE